MSLGFFHLFEAARASIIISSHWLAIWTNIPDDDAHGGMGGGMKKKHPMLTEGRPETNWCFNNLTKTLWGLFFIIWRLTFMQLVRHCVSPPPDWLCRRYKGSVCQETTRQTLILDSLHTPAVRFLMCYCQTGFRTGGENETDVRHLKSRIIQATLLSNAHQFYNCGVDWSINTRCNPPFIVDCTNLCLIIQNEFKTN